MLILVEDFNFLFKTLIDKQKLRGAEEVAKRANSEVFDYLEILCEELSKNRENIEFNLCAMLKKSYQEETSIFIVMTPGIHSLYSLKNLSSFLRNFERVFWT